MTKSKFQGEGETLGENRDLECDERLRGEINNQVAGVFGLWSVLGEWELEFWWKVTGT